MVARGLPLTTNDNHMQINVRFWDVKNKKMLYGLGISPVQQPIQLNNDGTLTELEGEYVPMLMTNLFDVEKKPIWGGDIVECDLQVTAFEGLPPSFIKKRGVMQYNVTNGMFTVNINSSDELKGQQFKVVNSRVIGDGYQNPELLEYNDEKK